MTAVNTPDGTKKLIIFTWDEVIDAVVAHYPERFPWREFYHERTLSFNNRMEMQITKGWRNKG